jgi:hypothetical protein
VASSARPAFQVGHADNHQGKVILPKAKEILAKHEASVARRTKENLSFDIRGNTSIYQKPYPFILIGNRPLLILIFWFC